MACSYFNLDEMEMFINARIVGCFECMKIMYLYLLHVLWWFTELLVYSLLIGCRALSCFMKDEAFMYAEIYRVKNPDVAKEKETMF